jgi:hypothetical protein
MKMSNAATQMKNGTKPTATVKPASDLPSLVKVEKGHAMAELKAEMAGRQEFYQQVTDMRIQHIDHCEAQSDAAVIAHVEGRQGEGFLDQFSGGMDALMNEFMPIGLVAGTDSRLAALPSSSSVV